MTARHCDYCGGRAPCGCVNALRDVLGEALARGIPDAPTTAIVCTSDGEPLSAEADQSLRQWIGEELERDGEGGRND